MRMQMEMFPLNVCVCGQLSTFTDYGVESMSTEEYKRSRSTVFSTLFFGQLVATDWYRISHK